MKKLLTILIASLAGCSVNGNQSYKDIYQAGRVLTGSCVSLKSFDPNFVLEPGSSSDNTFVGYMYSYDPNRLEKGDVFAIYPIPARSYSLVELLAEGDEDREAFWLNAKLQTGKVLLGHVFEAIVPMESHASAENTNISEVLLIRGSIHAACGKNFLVSIYSLPLGSGSDEWPRIRENYEKFIANISWSQ